MRNYNNLYLLYSRVITGEIGQSPYPPIKSSLVNCESRRFPVITSIIGFVLVFTFIRLSVGLRCGVPIVSLVSLACALLPICTLACRGVRPTFATHIETFPLSKFLWHVIALRPYNLFGFTWRYCGPSTSVQTRQLLGFWLRRGAPPLYRGPPPLGRHRPPLSPKSIGKRVTVIGTATVCCDPLFS